MAAEKSQRHPEREQTDLGLRHERENTDKVLLARFQQAEQDADRVLHRARRRADDVLEQSRAAEDVRASRAGQSEQERARVSGERAAEDHVIKNERGTADRQLQLEREQTALEIAALLPLQRDKTDRCLLAERLRVDDELANRDAVLAIISHDARNLLGGILSSATVLKTITPPENPQGMRVRAETARIERQIARMSRLVGDLVDLVSIDAGKFALAPTRCNVAALIRETVDMFLPVAQAKGISLEADEIDPSLSAEFDGDRVLQVLANLTSNAIKFTPREGHVRISCVVAEDELRFGVSDTGVGIPQTMRDAVFARFAQASHGQGGLGLGLYISKTFVEAHGGRIWPETPSSGNGTVMCFTLPNRTPIRTP